MELEQQTPLALEDPRICPAASGGEHIWVYTQCGFCNITAEMIERRMRDWRLDYTVSRLTDALEEITDLLRQKWN